MKKILVKVLTYATIAIEVIKTLLSAINGDSTKQLNKQIMARYRRRGNFRKRTSRKPSRRRGKPIRKIYISRGGIRL